MTLTLEPEARPMPERRRPRLQLREAAHKARTHAQQARQYAELWYQALLIWRVEYSRVPVPSISYHAERAHRQGQGITTLGEFLPDQPTMLLTPVGQVYESEVAAIINTMLTSSTFETSENGHLLDALRDSGQRKPGTLLRENGGWQPDAPRHAAWALAVLTLAVALRDDYAGQYLSYLRRVMRRPDVAD